MSFNYTLLQYISKANFVDFWLVINTLGFYNNMKNQKRSPLEHFFLLPGLKTWLKIYKDFCIAKISMYLGCLLKTVIWDVQSALERKKKSTFPTIKFIFELVSFLLNTIDVSMKNIFIWTNFTSMFNSLLRIFNKWS